VLRRVLTFFFFLGYVLALWLAAPSRKAVQVSSSDTASTLACQENLRRISLAFAQYAEDFDGKFPRGVDPEDRVPQTWQSGAGGKYADAALSAPRLVDLLQPYLHRAELWRCPDDNGWNKRPLGFESRLGVVQPSSWAKFGTSYYYYTIHGFAGLRPDDFPHPERDLLLFDGSFWHDGEPARTLNALFGDGHVENVSPKKFGVLADEQSQVLPR
jgi:prepilin-type processing-associated H-X9-DG protein